MNKTTFMAKPGQVERKWYVVDATDVPLGRLSAVVASVLRGKNKPTFTPHTDMPNVMYCGISSCNCLTASATLRMSAMRGGLDGAIFHSDHGSVYTSSQFQATCKRLGVAQSMGAVTSLDNFLVFHILQQCTH